MNWYVWGQSSSAQPPGCVFQKAKSSLGSRQLSEDPGKEHHGSPSLTGEEAGWARWAAEVKASGRSAVKESISLMQGRFRSNKHVPGLPQPEHWEATQAIQSRTGSESPSRGEPQLYEVTVLRIHISFSL